MNLQPSEFIANNPQRITMAPGTVVHPRNHIFGLAAHTGHHLSHEQFAARMHADNTDTLPVILFDPLDTGTDTGTDTNTDKENNND